jgi:hypothetical protein
MLFAIALSILLLAFLLFWLLLWKLPQWQVAAVSEVKDRIDLESKSRQTLVQIVGGAAALGALYFTAQTLQTSQETLETTQQGQITERFTKAIEQLGDKERLMIRLGGIYALERIARDSERDHWTVMEVLTAFLRENPVPSQEPPEDPTIRAFSERAVEDKLPEPPPHIQAILTVLRRRTRWHNHGETQRLNLQDVQLQYADLDNAHLEAANLWRANLKRAKLWGAHLEDALLAGAHLERATLISAHLERAMLIYAHLEGATLSRAHLEGAILGGAHLEGATLSRAHLEGAILGGAFLDRTRLEGVNMINVQGLSQAQIDTACIDEKTLLPAGLKRPQPCSANP